MGYARSKLLWNWQRRHRWSAVLGVIIILAMYNASTTMWLQQPTSRFLQTSTSAAEEVSEVLVPILKPTMDEFDNDPFAKMDLRLGHWDYTLTFKTFDYAAVGDLYSDVSSSRQVCLATQSSIESLREILNTAAHWSGPISLAIFVVGDEMSLLQGFAVWLMKCQPNIYTRLVMHLATPAGIPAVFGEMPEWALNCSAQPLPPESFKGEPVKTSGWRASHPYPQNLLRNLARKNCQTAFVYMVDIDIVPSKGMAEDLDKFLLSTPDCEKCAYVIPTYELDWKVPNFPGNKSELLRLAKKKLAVPFHKKVFVYNQLSSNLPKWEASVGEESNKTHVSHNVTTYRMAYEPFYVARDFVPPHDERFLGYGFTRNSQVYEMFLNGYTFSVLSPIFTIHWGLQSKKRPRWRIKQVTKNYKRFKIFQKELYAKYGKDPLGIFKSKQVDTKK